MKELCREYRLDKGNKTVHRIRCISENQCLPQHLFRWMMKVHSTAFWQQNRRQAAVKVSQLSMAYIDRWQVSRVACRGYNEGTIACWMPKTAACPFLPPAASKLPWTSMLQRHYIIYSLKTMNLASNDWSSFLYQVYTCDSIGARHTQCALTVAKMFADRHHDVESSPT